MKIAMVSPYSLDHRGGVQAQARLLVEWLRSENQEAWLVAPGSKGGPDGTAYLGDTVRIRANRSVAPVRLSRGTASAVGKAVAGADIVHIHEPFVPAVSIGALRVPGVAKVGTFHANPGRGVRLLYSILRRHWSRMAGNLSVATAVSPVAAQAVSGIVGNVRVIPNAIEMVELTDSDRRHPLRVAFLGRDEPRKGLGVLLEAWPAVRQLIPDAELVVMGSQRAAQPGVRFLGEVGDPSKMQELSAAAVFVAPNTGGESFGIVLLEAMSAGCAVVASDLPSFHHVAEDAAIYSPPRDAPALARALGTILSDRDVRSDYQRRSMDRVKAFDRRQVTSDYLKVYAEAVELAGG